MSNTEQEPIGEASAEINLAATGQSQSVRGPPPPNDATPPVAEQVRGLVSLSNERLSYELLEMGAAFH